jgi:hypothetical protein
VTEVIASDAAHLSIAKAAHLLGLKYLSVPIDANDSMDAAQLPTDLRKSALVLTAGATGTGAIDPLSLAGRAAWTHVDAAWAGPLRMSKYADLLAGIVVWRPKDERWFEPMLQQLPAGSTSITSIAGVKWFRNVSANPSADIDLLVDAIQAGLAECV